MSYLVIFKLMPRFKDYMFYQQKFAYFFLLFGHVVIGLMSAHWLNTILKNGLNAYLVFRKSRKPKGPFSWNSSFVGAKPRTDSTDSSRSGASANGSKKQQ